MKLQSRKLWMAGATSLQLLHIAATLYGLAWVFGSHPLAAQVTDAATTILGYVRDIVGFYLAMNVAQDLGHAVSEAIGRKGNE